MLNYYMRFSKELFRLWILILLSLITDYGADSLRSVRGLTDICVAGERCYGDLGCYPCFKGFHAHSPKKINMTFYLYTPSGKVISSNENVQTIPYMTFNMSVASARLDRKKDFWVITHGFEGQWPLPWLDLMAEALVDKGNNVLVARWSDGTAYPGNYAQACSNGRLVGVMIAQVVTEFEQKHGVRLDQTGLVGFSLGPHVIGAAGAALKGRARQIVGLDPANQFYFDAAPSDRLDDTDAQMVQVIHTNGAPLSKGVNLGTMVPMGDIDIYINGGEMQPGCPNTALQKLNADSVYAMIETIGCNHLRAPAIFTTSIKRNDCTFKAYPCNSKDDWYRGECFSCAGRGCVGVGYQMDPLTSQRGKFFLATQVDSGLREGDYCGPQYRITLMPDIEIHGEIKIVLKNDTADIIPNIFQKKDDIMTTDGRSVVIAARVTNPTYMDIAYDRYNILVRKGSNKWTLVNASVSLDDGTTFFLTEPATIINDHTTSARLGKNVISPETLATFHTTNGIHTYTFNSFVILFIMLCHILLWIS